MPDPPADPSGPADLFGRESRHREDLLTAFEQEWFAGAPPDLPAFVRRFLPPWLPRREPTVVELIRVDQEFRIKRGEPARAEDYLSRLDVRPTRDDLLDLLAGEFNLRSRFQVPPDLAEFAARFPELAGDLRRRLTGWTEAASAEIPTPVTPPPGSGTVLHVTAGPHRGTAIRLEPDRPLLVGRAASADVRLDADRLLSRFHLRLELADGRIRFADMNSRNGTHLNGEPRLDGELRPGDLLRCGESEIALATADGETLGTPATEIRRGTDESIPGYELCEVLGRGTLGTTYRAVSTATGDEVAIKQIDLPHAAAKTVAVIRETANLQTIAGHALLLPIDVGLAAGKPYVVWPRLRPVPFDALTTGKSPAERLPVACQIVSRLLTELAPLHAAGFVHGDIKSSNVLLEPDGEGLRVKLTDFGLARCFGRPGAGTAPQDDLLAAGRLLQEYVCGPDRRPPHHLPAAAQRLLTRTTAPDPADRPASAAEFAKVLKPFCR